MRFCFCFFPLFDFQVLKGIARCLVAEGQLEEAEQRFQKAMGMENARNPGASRATLEYCQVYMIYFSGAFVVRTFPFFFLHLFRAL